MDCKKHQANKPHCVTATGSARQQFDVIDLSLIEMNLDHLEVLLDIILFCIKQAIMPFKRRNCSFLSGRANIIQRSKIDQRSCPTLEP